MEIIDNVNKTLKDDMIVSLHSGSKVAIAASCFSIYTFRGLAGLPEGNAGLKGEKNSFAEIKKLSVSIHNDFTRN